jgi:hypothetical protein
MGSPFGLDFGAVMNVGMALQVDLQLLAEVLPAAEAEILANWNDEGSNDEPQAE